MKAMLWFCYMIRFGGLRKTEPKKMGVTKRRLVQIKGDISIARKDCMLHVLESSVVYKQ